MAVSSGAAAKDTLSAGSLARLGVDGEIIPAVRRGFLCALVAICIALLAIGAGSPPVIALGAGVIAAITLYDPLFGLAVLFFGTATGGRDFSHLALSARGVPIFVTEYVLVFIVIGIAWAWWEGRLEIKMPKIFALVGVILFLTVLRVGMAWSEWDTKTVRDSALFYYTAFVPIAYVVVTDLRRLSILVACYGSGLVLGLLQGIERYALGAGFVTDTGAMRFVGYDIAAGLAALVVLIIAVLPTVVPRLRVPLATAVLLALFGVAVSQVRAVFMGLALGLALVMLLTMARVGRDRITRAMKGHEWLWALVTVVAVGVLVVAGRGVLVPLFDRVVAGFAGTGSSSTWRLQAWSSALGTFTKHPLFGVGFGPEVVSPLLNYITVDRLDPHNFALEMLSRGGLVFFVLAMIVVVYTLVMLIRRAMTTSASGGEAIAAGLAGTILVFLGTSFFFPALCGPFISLFFWSFIGIGYRVAEDAFGIREAHATGA